MMKLIPVLTGLFLLGLSAEVACAQETISEDAELVRIKNNADPDAAPTQIKGFTSDRLLKILEDAPHNSDPRIVKGKFHPWLMRTEIFDAFEAILKDDNFRYDPYIRARLLTLSDTHPFTDVRATAKIILSDFQGERINPMFYFAGQQEGYDGPRSEKINEDMAYCAPPPSAKRPDFEIKAEAEAEASGYGRANYRFNIPMQYGTLSGGYYTIQGLGLSYKQNIDPYKTIKLNDANNRYVMPSNSKGAYWLIDGPHHMGIGGPSITKLVETQDGIERYAHRVLPTGVSQIFELSDGGIFISFVNLDPSKRGSITKDGVRTPKPLEWYNPPIILRPNGKIKLACAAEATEY